MPANFPHSLWVLKLAKVAKVAKTFGDTRPTKALGLAAVNVAHVSTNLSNAVDPVWQIALAFACFNNANLSFRIRLNSPPNLSETKAKRAAIP